MYSWLFHHHINIIIIGCVKIFNPFITGKMNVSFFARMNGFTKCAHNGVQVIELKLCKRIIIIKQKKNNICIFINSGILIWNQYQNLKFSTIQYHHHHHNHYFILNIFQRIYSDGQSSIADCFLKNI